MTPDDAMAALAAARLQLFAASQRREAVMLRRARLDGPEALDAINQDIADSRAAVMDATAAVQAAIAAAPVITVQPAIEAP